MLPTIWIYKLQHLDSELGFEPFSTTLSDQVCTFLCFQVLKKGTFPIIYWSRVKSFTDNFSFFEFFPALNPHLVPYV